MKTPAWSQRKIMIGIGCLALVAVIAGWRHSALYPGTDNAYVGANLASGEKRSVIIHH